MFIDYDSPKVALYSLLVELRVPRSAHCASGLMDAGSGGVPGFANDTCSVVSNLGSSTTISLRRSFAGEPVIIGPDEMMVGVTTWNFAPAGSSTLAEIVGRGLCP